MRSYRCTGVTTALLVLLTAAAIAHPMGETSINHVTKLSISAGRLDVRYVLDLAELPTVTAIQKNPSPTQLDAWAQKEQASVIQPALRLELEGGQTVELARGNAVASLRGKRRSLPTLYLIADFHAPLPVTAKHIRFIDGTFPGKPGWIDVDLSAEADPTDELTHYPDRFFVPTPHVRGLDVVITANGPVQQEIHTSIDAPAGTPVAGTQQPLAQGAFYALTGFDRRVVFIVCATTTAFVLGLLLAFGPLDTYPAIAEKFATSPRPNFVQIIFINTLRRSWLILIVAQVATAAMQFLTVPAHIFLGIASGIAIAVIGTHCLGEAISLHPTRGARHEEITLRHLSAESAVSLLAAIAIGETIAGMDVVLAFAIGYALGVAILVVGLFRGHVRSDGTRARYAPLLAAIAMSAFGALAIAERAVDLRVPVPAFAIVVLTVIAIAGSALWRSATSQRTAGPLV